MCYFYTHHNLGWTGVASGLDPEAPMQRPGTVGIFGLLCGLRPERGLLATRGGFVECLADFDIVQIDTLPYLTSTLVSVILWSGVAVTAAAMLSCYRYLGIGILGISHALVMLWRYENLIAGPLVWFRVGGCKVCATAQLYNGTWYCPTQHSTALHHWALHHTHYICPKFWWLMLGKPWLDILV